MLQIDFLLQYFNKTNTLNGRIPSLASTDFSEAVGLWNARLPNAFFFDSRDIKKRNAFYAFHVQRVPLTKAKAFLSMPEEITGCSDETRFTDLRFPYGQTNMIHNNRKYEWLGIVAVSSDQADKTPDSVDLEKTHVALLRLIDNNIDIRIVSSGASKEEIADTLDSPIPSTSETESNLDEFPYDFPHQDIKFPCLVYKLKNFSTPGPWMKAFMKGMLEKYNNVLFDERLSMPEAVKFKAEKNSNMPAMEAIKSERILLGQKPYVAVTAGFGYNPGHINRQVKKNLVAGKAVLSIEESSPDFGKMIKRDYWNSVIILGDQEKATEQEKADIQFLANDS